MTNKGSTRKLLRSLPEFRPLSGPELDTFIDTMICKEYVPGDVLWRTRMQLDLFVIIQTGEIILEHHLHGSVIRSVKLKSGDYVRPFELRTTRKHSFILARAVTDVRLLVLQVNRTGVLRSDLTSNDYFHQTQKQSRFSHWRRWWFACVAMLILLLSWNDGIRIISGALYLAANPVAQSNFEPQQNLNLLKRIEAFDQGAVFAYNQEGYIWFQQNDLHSAEFAFTGATNIDQSSDFALNNLAVTYYVTGRDPQATMLLQKAMQKNPDHAVLRYNLGLALSQQGYDLEALREFREASYIEPTWEMPYVQQGYLFMKMQHYDDAEQMARTAIRIDPTQHPAHLILAIALFNQQNDHEALKYVEKALNIIPNDGVSKFYKALILRDLGDYGAALQLLQELLGSVDDQQQYLRITAEIESLQREFPQTP